MGFKKYFKSMCLVTLASVFCLCHGYSSAAEIKVTKGNAVSDISLKNEVSHSIDKGLQWLKKQQDPKGYWSQPEYPAMSGLALTAFMGDPEGRFKTGSAAFIKSGYDYILQCIRPDGGIYVKSLANYNTSVCITALHLASNPAYEKVIKDARNFVVGLQGDFNEKGKLDSEYDGGIGYGDKYEHSDMSNTMFALESLYYTRYLQQNDAGDNTQLKELNWTAVKKFIERCQNLPGYNDQTWASDDPQNKGGFIYFPGDSKAGDEELEPGKKALRSYGSISYAGLLSYIYSDMDKSDPRVIAVYDWLKKNYTLDENPGMGKQGLYFYYYTMAKALSQYGVNEITLSNGKKINWRKDLALKILDLQKNDGFWVNDNARWWEIDPVLVTSYVVTTLEIIYRGL
jgi:squalene-hopene/tetraprenyl-beta-curcumene cyclase